MEPATTEPEAEPATTEPEAEPAKIEPEVNAWGDPVAKLEEVAQNFSQHALACKAAIAHSRELLGWPPEEDEEKISIPRKKLAFFTVFFFSPASWGWLLCAENISQRRLSTGT